MSSDIKNPMLDQAKRYRMIAILFLFSGVCSLVGFGLRMADLNNNTTKTIDIEEYRLDDGTRCAKIGENVTCDWRLESKAPVTLKRMRYETDDGATCIDIDGIPYCNWDYSL